MKIGALLLLGTLVRVVLMLYSAYHDRVFRVKYTDIDYMIITDGAAEVAHGGSPFDRATFRYTPLLAWLMLPNVYVWLHCGKALFALCDIGAAWYCYKTLTTFATERSSRLAVSAFILFNPIVVQVSTRGNSDMVVAFLSLAALANFFERRYVVAALWLGFAVHFKLYPIIYALPFVLGIAEHATSPRKGQTARLPFAKALIRTIPVTMLCAGAAVAAFAIPTAICYRIYGQQYLDEALLYHFSREDHRHNMSPYWLAMYLNQARRALPAATQAGLGLSTDYTAGFIAFLPQVAVLAYVSYRLRRNVAHACCVQTVLFVAFNKVCTVQYFVWFLPFLSFLFCTPLHGTSRVGVATALLVVLSWALTIPLWMNAAYQVEFLGTNAFVRLWVASCVFFAATVVLAAWLGRVALRQQEGTRHLRTE